MYIQENVYLDILNAFTGTLPERGGVLGSDNGETISKFYFDITGGSTADSYTPDYETINEILENEWSPLGVQMVGIIHSHESACPYPSCGDLYYCEQIMKSANIDTFLLPIVTLEPFKIHLYKAHYDGTRASVKKGELEIVKI